MQKPLVLALLGLTPAAALVSKCLNTASPRPKAEKRRTTSSASIVDSEGHGRARTLEVWERYNFAHDKAFWRDLRKGVYDGEVSLAQLERFEQFCDNYRADPEGGTTDPETGQTVCPIGNFPGLRAEPVHDPASFKWAPEFERRAGVIKSELDSFLGQASGSIPTSYKARRSNGSGSRADAWLSRDSAGAHWAGSDFHSIHLAKGLSNLPQAKAFPGTMRLLQSLDLIADREVAFHRQQPCTGLQRHSDKVNYVLAGHLGISVPANCGIQVADENLVWKEDKLLVIDNSFPHHTWNDSDEHRIIFYFDFFHPDLTAEERRALMIFKRTFKTHMRRVDAERQETRASLERLMGLGTDSTL